MEIGLGDRALRMPAPATAAAGPRLGRWARALVWAALAGAGLMLLAMAVVILAVLLLGGPMRGVDDRGCARGPDPLVCAAPPLGASASVEAP